MTLNHWTYRRYTQTLYNTSEINFEDVQGDYVTIAGLGSFSLLYQINMGVTTFIRLVNGDSCLKGY